MVFFFLFILILILFDFFHLQDRHFLRLRVAMSHFDILKLFRVVLISVFLV